MFATFGLSALPLLLLKFFQAYLFYEVPPLSYALFHNVTEFFSIMVSLSIFGVGWFTYKQTKDQHSLFLSSAFLVIGLMDFMHTLSNPVMPAFITSNSPNKSTQFWITVRLFQAVAFWASAYIYPERQIRWLSRKALMTSALLFSGTVFAWIIFFPSSVPDTFVAGKGLTHFKVFSECLVIFMFCLAAAGYWQRLKKTGDRLLIYYLAAFIICVFSELIFASYNKVFETYNILGHIYKTTAFFLIYKGLFIASVNNPYAKLADMSVTVSRLNTDLEQRVMERTSQLEAANKEISDILANITDCRYVLDNEWRFLHINDRALQYFEMKREDFLHKQLWDVLPMVRGTLIEEKFRKAVLDREPAEFETLSPAVGRWAELHLYPAGDSLIVNFRDISDRKHSEEALREREEQLKSMLNEKETLLRELYHRTKNNMNVISSLISLQTASLRSGEIQPFKELQHRIRSLSLVHERLYKSKDLSNVVLKDYITDLAKALLSSYLVSTSKISLKLEIDRCSLSIDTMTPLGLVINELMSNSLKYAFPDGRGGEIAIEAHVAEDGVIRLIYRDNGIGFPENLDFQTTQTLGMKLVDRLVKLQLGGKIELSRDGGTTFILTFREPHYQKRL